MEVEGSFRLLGRQPFSIGSHTTILLFVYKHSNKDHKGLRELNSFIIILIFLRVYST
ncbi:Protein of unknown function [Pyronema omphalodes CBS 100304]|uniref:Uncharacterized protein n=1 Tax=Pyronema omphalodes (strain CBS 100304) TaxID=1076935 RepID=U4KVJ2_PYROM|nr:Protein of unknown function [Pyronema omphalodes CBS 100304]